MLYMNNNIMYMINVNLNVIVYGWLNIWTGDNNNFVYQINIDNPIIQGEYGEGHGRIDFLNRALRNGSHEY